ncbi:MAG: ATP-binding cassette subfamily C bacterial [Spirochaetes bacterium]|nr:MAG: ATP-binding cassette subfamily C bacterial [Spirochaetota bacterium]
MGIGLSALNGLTGALGRNLFALIPESLRLPSILIVYIALIALQSVVARKSRIFEYRLSGGFAASLRKRYFGAALQARWESHLSRKKTDIHSSLTLEIERISYGALNLLKMMGQSFVALVQFAIVFAISPLLSTLVCLGGIVFFSCTLPWNLAARKMGQKMVNLNRALHASLGDKIAGIKEAKIYGAESLMEKDFGEVCEGLKDNVAGIAEIQTRPDFLYRLGSALLVSAFIYVGLELAELSISVLLIQVFVFARLWPLFSSFQTGFQQLVTMLPSYESFGAQIAEFYTEAEMLPASGGEIRLESSLKAENLSFSYAGGGGFSLEGVFPVKAKFMWMGK